MSVAGSDQGGSGSQVGGTGRHFKVVCCNHHTSAALTQAAAAFDDQRETIVIKQSENSNSIVLGADSCDWHVWVAT